MTALRVLEILNEHLIEHGVIAGSQVVAARCPIIKGTEFPFGFSVDIALNNHNGVMNIERHHNYLSMFPCLRPLLMFLKCFLYQNQLGEPFSGGVGSNTLIQMIVSIIHSAPGHVRLSAGAMLLAFFRCFGETFNYVVTGITTRNGGRLFNRLRQCCLNLKSPVSLCVEDPQSPGSFLGQNASQAGVIREKCRQATHRLSRNPIGYEQSTLGRVIEPSVVLELMTRRAQVEMSYTRLCGIEAFSLDQKAEEAERQVTRGVVLVPPFERSRP
jgi:DNA polymerase sigma